MSDTGQWQERTAMLLGPDALRKLAEARVLVVGLGGVGAIAAEQILRAGVSHMTIADGDVVSITNLNRQLLALHSTLGQPKAEVLKRRLLDINPAAQVTAYNDFVRDEKTAELLDCGFDLVLDAIDSLSPKVNLIEKALSRSVRVVSAMGAGGKFDPAAIRICDISKSYNCKLAKAVRKRLHRRGIDRGFRVVFSPEEVADGAVEAFEDENGMSRSQVGSISYLTAAFGCFCASAVIGEILAREAD